MDFQEMITTIYQKKKLIFWITVLGALLAFDLAVIQTPKYQSNFKILITQKETTGQDIYTISKSAQYLMQVLEEGIYSDDFFYKVISLDNQIEEENFSPIAKERRKEWQKIIEVQSVRDLGVLEINIFYPEKDKAESLGQTIANVLKSDHSFYHGSKENVELKILNSPLVSSSPVRTWLWLETILGAFIGFLFGSILALKEKIKAYFLYRNIPSI